MRRMRVVRSRRNGRAGNNQFVRLRLLWCVVWSFLSPTDQTPKVVIMREKASLSRSLVRLCDWLITLDVETFTTRFGRCRSLVPRLWSVREVLGAPPTNAFFTFEVFFDRLQRRYITESLSVDPIFVFMQSLSSDKHHDRLNVLVV